MSSDASIYSLLRPATPIADPLEQYGKVQNLRALMGQNQLQGLQTDKLTRDIQEEQDFKTGLADLGPTGLDDSAVTRLMAISPTRGLQLQKTLLENRKNQSDLDLNKARLPGVQQDAINKLTAAHRDALDGVNDPQTAAQWVQSAYQDPVLGPVVSKMRPLQDALASIPTDPAAFQQWKQQSALGATKYIELNKPANLQRQRGDVTETLAIPGLGGAPQVIASAPMGVTPGEKLTDERTRAEGAAGRAVTIRGQNLTDARQRELNGIMEGQGPQDISGVAKMIANHDLPMPNPPSQARNPMAMVRYGELVKAVQAENPTYNAQDYPTAQAALTAFAKGKQGDSTRFISTAADHVNTLREMAGALKNGNIQLFNKVANAWAEQTGNPAPTNWDTARQIVGGEVVKGIVGAGGGVEDRSKAQGAFDRAKSPAQIDDAIKVAILPLLNGQLKGLEQQYKAGTGRKDFREKYLTEGARKAFGSATAPASGATPAPGATHPDFPGFSIVKP